MSDTAGILMHMRIRAKLWIDVSASIRLGLMKTLNMEQDMPYGRPLGRAIFAHLAVRMGTRFITDAGCPACRTTRTGCASASGHLPQRLVKTARHVSNDSKLS